MPCRESPASQTEMFRKTLLSHRGGVRVDRKRASTWSERPLLSVTMTLPLCGDHLLTSVTCCQSPKERGRWSAATVCLGKPISICGETYVIAGSRVWAAGCCVVGAGLSRSIMSDSSRPRGLQPARLLCPRGSPGQNTGVGCHALLQGIFPTQGSNPGLLHCRRILCRLSHQTIQQ